MLGLEEFTVRYKRITERIQDRKYMMGGYLGNETKMTYDFEEILDNWSNMNIEDLDMMHSWILRHIECFNELGKMLIEEK